MKQLEPQFSVVIPVRNGELYISSTLESILVQINANLEIIILDNCSTDRTVEIARSYHDPRLSIIPSTTDLSIEENWARILELDLAEYITVIGHDDLYYPDFLGTMAQLIEDCPEASLYHAHFDIIDGAGEVIRPCRKMPYKESAEQFLIGRQRRKRDCYGTGYVTRTQDFLEAGGFPEYPRLIYSDDVLWYQLASKSSRVCSPRTLFAYRSHKHSSSASVDVSDLYRSSRRYIQFCSSLPNVDHQHLDEETRRFVERQFRGRVKRILADLMVSQEKEQIRQYQEQMEWAEEQANREELFQVHSPMITLLEYIVILKFPRWMKLAVARSISLLTSTWHSLRDHFLR